MSKLPHPKPAHPPQRNSWLSFRGEAEESPHFAFHEGAQRHVKTAPP